MLNILYPQHACRQDSIMLRSEEAAWRKQLHCSDSCLGSTQLRIGQIAAPPAGAQCPISLLASASGP